MRQAIGISILLAATLTVPQVRAQKSQGFAETTEVVAVEVPVQVVGKDGEPVRGLTANDFEVFEGRRQMPVTGFEVVDLEVPATAARASAVPATARRHFLLLFDLSFSEPKSIEKAREAARKLVLGLHSSDLISVASYHSSTGPTLVLGFTTDRRQVDTALDQVGLDTGKSNDPLRLVMRRGAGRPGGGRPVQAASPNVAATTEGPDFRVGSADTIAAYNDKLSNSMGSGDMESQKRDVTALTRSFADLAKVMGGVQGRKYVVYLSEGYDSRLLQGTTDQTRVDEMATASQSGEMWNVDSEERYGSTKTANDVERMLEEFRRADCVIQAVDIGGLQAGAEIGKRRTGGKDSLLQMAKGTGGELYENLNDLSSAMDKVLRKTSVTYVLAFQPEKLKFDGSYHKLRVELRDPKGARGARVMHRPGFYAPKPFADRNPFERLLDASTRLMSGEEAGPVDISVLAAPFRVSSDGLSYVPVVIEVNGPALLSGQAPAGAPGTVPAEIYVYAFDAAGAIPDFVTQTLGLDLAKVEPVLRQSGLKFFGHLDLFPGTYSLRVLVRNGSTGAYGLRVASLVVPDPVEAEPVLLPPFFPEAPGKWLMAREVVPAGEKTPPYPFMVKNQPFIPASKPVLPLGEPAAVSLMGYNLAPGNVEVRSEVLSIDGREIGSGELQVLEREAGSIGGGTDRLKGTFRPPALEPGEYLLRVTLTDADGGSGTSTTPFVIAKKTS
jgi:VWFA-related protein